MRSDIISGAKTYMFDVQMTAKLLKLSDVDYSGSVFDLLDSIEFGLPVRAAKAINAIYEHELVTVSRSSRKLTKEQGELVVRLARLWIAAKAVWISDDSARAFLTRGHLMLKNKTPVQITMQSEIGLEIVCCQIGKLEAGTAA